VVASRWQSEEGRILLKYEMEVEADEERPHLYEFFEGLRGREFPTFQKAYMPFYHNFIRW